MRKILCSLLSVAVLVAASLLPSAPVQASSIPKPQVIAALRRMPLSFEANRGQTDHRVSFLARGTGFTLFLTGDGATFARQGRQVLRWQWVGANRSVRQVGEAPLPGRVNYFATSDSSKWHVDIPTYQRVRATNIYQGIDAVYYGSHGQLEYDFIVRPKADPSRIRMRLTGAKNMRIDKNGELRVVSALGEIHQHRPLLYQIVRGQRQSVTGRWKLLGHNEVGFTVGKYDHSRTLVIDPVLVYSTFLGAVGDGVSGSYSAAITVDASGSVYVGSLTDSANFPTTPGVYEPVFNNGAPSRPTFGPPSIGAITKFDPTGSSIVWSTYLGQGIISQPIGIAVDGVGNVYVAGNTQSWQFPTTPGAYDTTFNDPNRCVRACPTSDGFVSKLSPTGSTLIYSTFLGGPGDSEFIGNIAVDGAGNAYIVGSTYSPEFPTTPGAFQTRFSGGQTDGFVTKLNASGSALIWSTFLGSADGDGLQDLVLLPGGEVLVGGYAGINYPTTNGAYSTTYNGSSDAVVSQLNSSGSALVASTYLGGSGVDGVYSLARDSGGNIYLTGTTTSSNFPTTTGAYQSTRRGSQDFFVARLNGGLNSLTLSTYLGGDGSNELEIPLGIAVDSVGRISVGGYTYSTNFPTTPDALQPTFGGGISDAVFAQLDTTGSILLYSTYLGGVGNDYAYALASDSQGNIYLTGGTTSINFPVTPGAYDTTFSGGTAPPSSFYSDVFIIKFSP